MFLFKDDLDSLKLCSQNSYGLQALNDTRGASGDHLFFLPKQAGCPIPNSPFWEKLYLMYRPLFLASHLPFKVLK